MFSLRVWRKKRAYNRWKRDALKAVEEGRVLKCDSCSDPIVPGDFIAFGRDPKTGEEVVAHAGFHFSISEMDAFCVTGALGSAVWNGEEIIWTGESLASKTFRTGAPQAM